MTLAAPDWISCAKGKKLCSKLSEKILAKHEKWKKEHKDKAKRQKSRAWYGYHSADYMEERLDGDYDWDNFEYPSPQQNKAFSNGITKSRHKITNEDLKNVSQPGKVIIGKITQEELNKLKKAQMKRLKDEQQQILNDIQSRNKKKNKKKSKKESEMSDEQSNDSNDNGSPGSSRKSLPRKSKRKSKTIKSNENVSESEEKEESHVIKNEESDSNELSSFKSSISGLSRKLQKICIKLYKTIMDGTNLVLNREPFVNVWSIRVYNMQNCAVTPTGRCCLVLVGKHCKLSLNYPMNDMKQFMVNSEWDSALMHCWKEWERADNKDLKSIFLSRKKTIYQHLYALCKSGVIEMIIESQRPQENWMCEVLQAMAEEDDVNEYLKKQITIWNVHDQYISGKDKAAMLDIIAIRKGEGLKTVKMSEYFAQRVLSEWNKKNSHDLYTIAKYLDLIARANRTGDLFGVYNSIVSYMHEIKLRLARKSNLLSKYDHNITSDLFASFTNTCKKYTSTIEFLKGLSALIPSEINSNQTLSRTFAMYLIAALGSIIKQSRKLDYLWCIFGTISTQFRPEFVLFNEQQLRYQQYCRTLFFRHGKPVTDFFNFDEWNVWELAVQHIFNTHWQEYDIDIKKAYALGNKLLTTWYTIHIGNISSGNKETDEKIKTKFLTHMQTINTKFNMSSNSSGSNASNVSNVSTGARSHSRLVSSERDNNMSNNNNSNSSNATGNDTDMKEHGSQQKQIVSDS